MKLLQKNLFFLVSLLLLLTACSANIEDQEKKAHELVKRVLEKEAKETNVESKGLLFHLPNGMKMDDSDPHNIIVTEGESTYILFINPQEDRNSKVVYEATLHSADDFRYNETFDGDGQFGYLLIHEIANQEEVVYEVIVGVGGVKMTTITKAKDVASKAEMMMEVVTSVRFDNKIE